MTTSARPDTGEAADRELRRLPPLGARLAVALVIAAVAGAYVARLAHVMPHYGTDFDPVRYAAKLVREGRNPYALIGPGREVFWNYRLLYPMPAVVLGLPFTLVSLVPARAVFVALSSFALAFAATRRGWRPLVVFASASWWGAVAVAQWSPVLLASAFTPWLGFVVAAKPNVGLAILAAAPSKRAFIIMLLAAVAIFLISFVVMPTWLPQWREAALSAEHVRPIAATFPGAILLLSALNWRRPEARLLLVLALVPMNPGLYEGVLLFLIPQTLIEALLLAVGSWFVEPLSQLRLGSVDVGFFAATGHAMLWCMYFPALSMVVRHKNRGTQLNS